MSDIIQNHIETARHDIDTDLLTETGTAGFFSKGFVNGPPIHTYLDDRHPLKYLLWSEKNPIEIDGQTPTDSAIGTYRAVTAITTNAIHLINPTETQDIYHEIPIAVLDSVSVKVEEDVISTIETLNLQSDTQNYHIYDQSTADLGEVSSYLTTRKTSTEKAGKRGSDQDTTTHNSSDTSISTTAPPSKDRLVIELQSLQASQETLLTPRAVIEDSDYTRQTFYDEFGSWDDALEAADITKGDYLLADLASVWADIGEQPTTTQMNRQGAYSASLYIDYFGSWTATIQALENSDSYTVPDSRLNENEDDGPSERELRAELESLGEELGRPPKASEMNSLGGYSAPTYTDHFGSWETALEAVGYDREQYLLNELKRVAEDLGQLPTTTKVQKADAPSSGMYTQYFGSWDEAIESLQEERTLDIDTDDEPDTTTQSQGIEESCRQAPDSMGQATKSESNPEPSRKELIRELQGLNKTLDRLVRPTDIADESLYSRQHFYNKFGSWDAALGAADIDKGEYLLDDLKRVWEMLGYEPTTSDMNQHGEYSSTVYANFFGSWTTAKDKLRNRVEVPSQKEQVGFESSRSGVNDAYEFRIEEISSDGRLPNPVPVRVNSITEEPGEKKTALLTIEDPDGTTCRLSVWRKHSVTIDWTVGDWYLLEEARGKRWASGGVTKYGLSSTKDLTVRKLDSETIPREGVGDDLEKGTNAPQEQTDQNQDESHSAILDQIQTELE